MPKRPPPGSTYRQQYVACGKKPLPSGRGGCRKCGGTRPAHGPYWYAFKRRPDGGVTSYYVGKERPAYIGEELEAPAAPAVEAPRPPAPHWVTLSNKRRVKVDELGRIVAGLPDRFNGVHVRDVSLLSRELEKIEREEAACKDASAPAAAETFHSANVAVKSLIDANPELASFLERECSHDCDRFAAWHRGGRKGSKPKAAGGDGRFDAVNERFEKKGGHAVASWLEAVYAIPPPSRRWEDFPSRLEVLEEATGLRLVLPAEAERLELSAEDVGRCEAEADRTVAELLGRARAGRLERGADPELEAAPF